MKLGVVGMILARESGATRRDMKEAAEAARETADRVAEVGVEASLAANDRTRISNAISSGVAVAQDVASLVQKAENMGQVWNQDLQDAALKADLDTEDEGWSRLGDIPTAPDGPKVSERFSAAQLDAIMTGERSVGELRELGFEPAEASALAAASRRGPGDESAGAAEPLDPRARAEAGLRFIRQFAHAPGSAKAKEAAEARESQKQMDMLTEALSFMGDLGVKILSQTTQLRNAQAGRNAEAAAELRQAASAADAAERAFIELTRRVMASD